MKITKTQLKQIIKEELDTIISKGPGPSRTHDAVPYASADPETDREIDIFPLVHRLAVDDDTGDELPEHEKAELSQQIYNLIIDRVREYFGSSAL